MSDLMMIDLSGKELAKGMHIRLSNHSSVATICWLQIEKFGIRIV